MILILIIIIVIIIIIIIIMIIIIKKERGITPSGFLKGKPPSFRKKASSSVKIKDLLLV